MELEDLKPALEEPFAVELITFKPGKKLDNGTCIPLAFVSWQEYIKRLNTVCYGQYHIPEPRVYAFPGKIIISQAVWICGVEMNNVGETLLTDRDNDVCNAYDQGLKRACSLFGIGLDLYDLKIKPVPFDGKRILTPDLVLAVDAYLDKGYPVSELIVEQAQSLRTAAEPTISTSHREVENVDLKKKKIDQLAQYNKLSRVFLEQLTLEQLSDMQRSFMNHEDRDSILAKFDYKEPTTSGSYRRPWKTN